MYIYLTLLLPILTATILYIFFKKSVVWWELLIPFGATLIIVGIVKLIGDDMQTSATEYINDVVVEARYYEDWDEEVSCTHSYDCNCTTDSKGNKSCSTCYEHPYDVDYHPKRWVLITRLDHELDITENEYNRLLSLYGNKAFVDMGRSYHSKDGDMYKTCWDNTNDKLQCIVYEHTYKNKVRVSNSIFNFPEVTTQDKTRYSLFDYPQILSNYKQPNILGAFSPKAERNMEILNGLYGSQYQLKAFILVFKGKSQMSGKLQQWYWKGGNKNEFILCIGVDKNDNIKWVYPFTWSEKKESSIELRNFVLSKTKLDLVEISNEMIKDLKGFKRKQFKDFDYLQIDPTPGQIITTIILAILINIGSAFFVVLNDVDDEDDKIFKSKRNYKKKLSVESLSRLSTKGLKNYIRKFPSR